MMTLIPCCNQQLKVVLNPAIRRPLFLVGLIVVQIAALPAIAETCTTKVVNGEQVVLCCDGNGVCYRK